MILRPGRDRRRRRAARSPARRSPSPATCPPPAAVSRSTRSSSATVPDEPARAELAAYGVRTVHHADRRRRSTAYAGAAWAAAVAGRPRGGRLGRRDGRRHRPRQRGARPRRGPRSAWRWPPTCSSFDGLVAVRGDPPGASAAPRWRRCALDRAAGGLHGRRARRRGRRRPSAGRRPTVVERRPRSRPRPTWSPGWSRPSGPEPDESGSLKSARVVVGAGRGAGGADGFGDLARAHRRCSAAPLGVSRVVTSLGWRPHHEQVGQTGSRISPGPLHPVRHQRRHPALGRLLELEDDPGDQHRRRRADGDQGALRRDRRPARDRAGHQRGDPPPRPRRLTGRLGSHRARRRVWSTAPSRRSPPPGGGGLRRGGGSPARSGVAQEVAPVPCSQASTLSGLASIHFWAASSGVMPSWPM